MRPSWFSRSPRLVLRVVSFADSRAPAACSHLRTLQFTSTLSSVALHSTTAGPTHWPGHLAVVDLQAVPQHTRACRWHAESSPVQPLTPSQRLLTCCAPTQLDLLPLSPPGLPQFARSDTTPLHAASSCNLSQRPPCGAQETIIEIRSWRIEVHTRSTRVGTSRKTKKMAPISQPGQLDAFPHSCSCSLLFSGLAASKLSLPGWS